MWRQLLGVWGVFPVALPPPSISTSGQEQEGEDRSKQK